MRRLYCLIAAPILLNWTELANAAPLAEILSVSGRGEQRGSADAPWQAAKVKQGLDDGHYVRTLEASSLALLFSGQTQIKLGSESLFHIKAPTQNAAATLDLKKGRSWSQVKAERPTTAVAQADTAPQLRVTTPGGVAAIRGTEWAIEVGDDGLTTVAVLEGRVEFGNPQGSVSIGPSEEASARPGEAPVKRQLVNAQSRVQWVATYRFPWPRYPELSRPEWKTVRDALRADDLAAAGFALRARDRSDLGALLLAELALARGEPGRVEQLLAGLPTAEARASALRTEAALRADAIDAARRLVETAPPHAETALAAGEFHRLDGAAMPAIAAFERARQAAPNDMRGWLGGAKVATEREDLGQAWPMFDTAKRLSPDDALVLAELAHADTLGGEFAAARAGYEKALRLAPDDFVAWTGLGLLELKTGHTEASLEPLLKATAIEPRYARAALYTGIAYWQLGRAQNALDTFARAARLDPNDPLPHFYAAMIHTDRLEPGAAVAAAQRAIALWPKLKSLNQVASDQKGSANLGATLERFGLEEWALAAAWQAYTPFWGASHLFLADRTHDTYGKNSELFQGFLADPLVFGADPRRNALIARPEAVFGARAKTSVGPQRINEVGGLATGYRAEPVPLAWFADIEASRERPDDMALKGDLANLTLGVGARPSFDTGLFLFANRYRRNLNFTDVTNELINTDAQIAPLRVDAGLHKKLAPDSHLWFKVGFGSQDRSIVGSVTKEYAKLGFNQGPNMLNLNYRDTNDNLDVQFKRAWTDGMHSMHLVLEYAENDSKYNERFEWLNSFGGLVYTGSITDQKRRSARLSFNDWISYSPALQFHLQATYTDFDQDDQRRQVANTGSRLESAASTTHLSRFSPRIGAVWNFAVPPAPSLGQGRVRLALREWLQPVGAATLDRLDTAGLQLDTRAVRPGGLLKNGKLQLEWENARSMYSAYVEAERVDNRTEGFLPAISAVLTDLEKLRQKAPDNVAGEDVLEGTPNYSAGRGRAAGLAGNWILDSSTSAYARAILRSSEDRRDNPGADLPYTPRRTFVFGGTRFLGAGWTMGAQGVYRSESFADSAHATRLPAGWGVDAYVGWRSADRNWRAAIVAKGLGRERPAPRSLLAQVETWW